MKWIKLFEAFDKSDYYKEIKTPIEQSIHNVDMSKKMADKIENLFMGTDENGEPMMDPNVYIEYGQYPGPGPDAGRLQCDPGTRQHFRYLLVEQHPGDRQHHRYQRGPRQ